MVPIKEMIDRFPDVKRPDHAIMQLKLLPNNDDFRTIDNNL